MTLSSNMTKDFICPGINQKKRLQKNKKKNESLNHFGRMTFLLYGKWQKMTKYEKNRTTIKKD